MNSWRRNKRRKDRGVRNVTRARQEESKETRSRGEPTEREETKREEQTEIKEVIKDLSSYREVTRKPVKS